MAKRVHVVLEDDLDGSPADRTVPFAWDGVSYEIDLSDDHYRQLKESLADVLANARKTGGNGTGRTRQTRSTGGDRDRSTARVDREQIKAIRDWARRNGREVSDRGRIAAPIVAAYNEAHGDGSSEG